jgi:hypothetical protein
MTATHRLSPIERAAKSQLEATGYTVVPMIPCFPNRHKPAHLMAYRNTTGLLYLKLKETPRKLADIAAIEQFCHNDVRVFRQLFPLNRGKTALHLEIWILKDTGRFSCYEVLANELREVFHV